MRFSFEGCWNKKKLNDISVRITRKNKKLESTLPLTISAEYGLVDQETFFNRKVASNNIEGYYLLYNGEFAYNKSYSNNYPWGAIKRLDLYDKGVISTLYICFKPKDEINSDYLTHYFETTKWHNQISEIAVEGARNHGLLNVPVNDFFNTIHMFPTYEEQLKLSTFLNLIQSRINTQRKIIEFYESLIKLIYNNILSAEANQKLGELCEIKKGTQLNTENFENNGIYPVINGGINISGYTNTFNSNNLITISEGGNSCGYVNYFKEKFWSGGHNYTLIKKYDFNYDYLFHYLKYKEKEIMSLRVGSGLPNIQKPALLKFPIYLPEISVQNKYTIIMNTILDKINIEKGILRLYTKEKEYLLNKLFI